MGRRDPAQPLLTLYDGSGRVELSGATTANWVAKSANLLVDGLGGPARIGLLLPLHWQSVALMLAGAAAGAEVVIAAVAADLDGCDAVFTTPDQAAAAFDFGADEVVVLSGHPLGAPVPATTALPAMAQDYAREVPSYGDHFPGPLPSTASLSVQGTAVPLPAPLLDLTAGDRILTTCGLHTADGLGVVLAALGAGASLVLLVGDADAAAISVAERVTAVAGLQVADLPRLA